MKLAWVASARVEGSELGAYGAQLVPELARIADLRLFVEPEAAVAELHGLPTQSVDRLVPREFDHVLHHVGDEACAAFLVPLIRALGGTVVLHEWRLFSLARAAFPKLTRGGLLGTMLAAREGGLAEALRYRRWMASTNAASEEAPALNRGVVRFGDSFLTHSPTLARAIEVERNAPTPIRVLEPSFDGWGVAVGRLAATLEDRAGELAAAYIAALDRMPPPRTARKTLVARAFAAKLREPRRP